MRHHLLQSSVKYLLVTTLLLGAMLFAHPQKALAYSSNGVPVIFVHGFNKDASIPGGCNGNTNFGSIKTYFANNGWTGPMISESFYNGDTNCDKSLHWEDFRCTGWYAGNEGNAWEDLRHVSCLLAWAIWDNYTVNGIAVKLIGHSVGGIIIRQALSDTPYVSAFPPFIYVEDVVTAGTPHQGLATGSAGSMCLGCLQMAQVEQHNAFLQFLNDPGTRGGFGRNPQGNGGTDWTTMASFSDGVLFYGSAKVFDTFGGYIPNSNHLNYLQTNAILCGFMPGATHLVGYWGSSPSYAHGDYLTDQNTAWSADVAFSDNNGGNWTATTTMAHSIKTMLYAVGSTGW